MNVTTRTEQKMISMRVLEGQRALVTGANSGIGEGVAKALAEAGAKVAVNFVAGPDQAERVVSDIRQSGNQAMAIQADVSQEAQVEAMFARVVDTWGSVDIVVNNAGLQRDAPLHEMTLKQWQFVLDVNLTGQFLCARAAVREFLRRGVERELSVAAGKIVCMSSVHDVIPWAGHANYAASKGGVSMLMKTMAQELAQHRIRVNAISPGAIKTPINRDAWSMKSRAAAVKPSPCRPTSARKIKSGRCSSARSTRSAASTSW